MGSAARCVCACVCVRVRRPGRFAGSEPPMEIETRSFRMQNKSFVLSQCYAVTAVSLPPASNRRRAQRRRIPPRHAPPKKGTAGVNPQATGMADGDRNAGISNANKSFADRRVTGRVTGDPPCSSPKKEEQPLRLKHSTAALNGVASPLGRTDRSGPADRHILECSGNHFGSDVGRRSWWTMDSGRC
jgi:hypothetical protein